MEVRQAWLRARCLSLREASHGSETGDLLAPTFSDRCVTGDQEQMVSAAQNHKSKAVMWGVTARQENASRHHT